MGDSSQSSADMAARVQRVEETCGFAQHELEQLSAEVAELSRRLLEVSRRLASLEGKVGQMEAKSEEGGEA